VVEVPYHVVLYMNKVQQKLWQYGIWKNFLPCSKLFAWQIKYSFFFFFFNEFDNLKNVVSTYIYI